MKIALDPTPFHHDYELLEFPRVVAELGDDNLQLTPHEDLIPFDIHPRADDDLVAKFRKACEHANVGIASVCGVRAGSGRLRRSVTATPTARMACTSSPAARPSPAAGWTAAMAASNSASHRTPSHLVECAF